jgi:hypothetical protein
LKDVLPTLRDGDFLLTTLECREGTFLTMPHEQTFGTADEFGICCSVTSDHTISGLLIQTDEKIVAMGEIDGNLAVARYRAN